MPTSGVQYCLQGVATVKEASLHWFHPYVEAPLLVPTPHSSTPTNSGPALFLQWSQPSPGEWGMVVKRWLQDPEKRACLCGCRYNIHCFCQEGTKGSDVKQTKTTVPQQTHSSMWLQGGHQDYLSTTGNVTTQAILHLQLAEAGTLALSVNVGGGRVQVFKEGVGE